MDSIRKTILQIKEPFCLSDLYYRMESEGFTDRRKILDVLDELFDCGLVKYIRVDRPEAEWAFSSENPRFLGQSCVFCEHARKISDFSGGNMIRIKSKGRFAEQTPRSVRYTVEDDVLIIGDRGWLFLDGDLGEIVPGAREVIIERKISPMYLSFRDMKRLERIIGLRNVDTSNITSMAGMFRNCPLKEIDLEGFDTSNVTDMSEMFENTRIRKINLNCLDVRNVRYFDRMFYGCGNLREIYFRNFLMSNPESCEDMFGSDPLKRVEMSYTGDNEYLKTYMTEHRIFRGGLVKKPKIIKKKSESGR